MSERREQTRAALQGNSMAKVARSNSQSNADRVGVMVLGMHRSGTSALTRMLNLLGCDLPKTMMAANWSNEAGHWESCTIASLNDEILESGGSNWHDWLAFNPSWASSPKAAEFKDKALAALEAEFGQSRLFVLKDPRICRLVPFWLDVLESAGIRPVIISPARNPLEVAESLEARDGIDPALGQLLWLRHVLEAEAGSRGLSRCHTSYDALLTGWPKLAAAAQAALGISWPRLSPRASEEIDEFLSKRLRHHHQPQASVLDNPLLSEWLRETFDVFSRWADKGENDADYATLDRIRTELNAAAPAFARLILAGERSTAKARELEANLTEISTKLSQAEAAVVTQQGQVEGLDRQLTETRAALDGARGELSHSQSELAQRRAEADDAVAELREAERRFAAELESERARHADEQESERARHATRVDEIASLTQVLQELEKSVEDAAQARARLAEELETERNRAKAELEQLRREKRTAEGRLAERFGEIAIMTRLLGEKEDAARASAEQADWLRQVSALLLNGSAGGSLKARLAAFVPAPIRRKQQMALMKRSGMFDPNAYLAAYPDVAEAGLDPLWHYINHGIGEGRQFHPNQPRGGRRGDHETSK